MDSTRSLSASSLKCFLGCNGLGIISDKDTETTRSPGPGSVLTGAAFDVSLLTFPISAPNPFPRACLAIIRGYAIPS